jgi:hypothetical protein
MLPVGLIGFMLSMGLEEDFYADPPKNKFGGSVRSSEHASTTYQNEGIEYPDLTGNPHKGHRTLRFA